MPSLALADMLLLLSMPALADPLDVPVPSPCTQESDTDGDGRIDFVQTYVYDADRVLAEIRTDDDGDGVPDAIVRYAHASDGAPTRSFHDWDADGHVDTVKDCSKTYCSTNWIPVCPSGMSCSVGSLGLITTMQRGSLTVTNTYACWVRIEGLWTYMARP